MIQKLSTLLLFVVLCSCSSREIPPNIVLIISDDQGFGDFGFTGNSYVSTPHLDALKEQSVYFDRFYVSPVCAPTRASLLTGRYHLRTGTTWVTHGLEVMRSEERTIAESLSEHGYSTACYGKWHNGEHYPHNPNGQGFDTFFGFSAGHWNNYFDPRMEYNGSEVTAEGYIIDVLTDSALHFMDRNKDKPFFCYVPYNTPHGPFQVADRYFDKYKEMGLDDKNAAVYGMCENIDDNVGRILSKLEDLGLSDHTIVLYLTDNGPNGHRYNAGMKGIKGHVDEGGIRTPLLIRYPGVLPAGDTVFGLASHIDLLPTLHGLTGIDFEETYPLDGIDLSEYMASGSKIPDRMIFTHQVNRELRATPASVRTPQYRLVMNDGDTMLYDMKKDPGQEQDIASAHQDIVLELSDTLGNWFREVSASLPYHPPIPVGYEAAPRVTLPAPEATRSGSVQFKGEIGWANDWLTGFSGLAGISDSSGTSDSSGSSEISDTSESEGSSGTSGTSGSSGSSGISGISDTSGTSGSSGITDTSGDQNSAAWQVHVVTPGSYMVHARFACENPGHGDQLMVKYNDKSLYFEIKKPYTAPIVPVRDRVPRTEVVERTWPEVMLGRLVLDEGPGEIEVSFSGNTPGGLELRELILIME